MIEVEDLRGELVQVGDTIAYAVTEGRSANVRIGKVVEIVWEHEVVRKWDKEKLYGSNVPTKLRVLVEKSAFGRLYSDKPVLIQTSFKRFVKLPELPPPPLVPKTREEMAAFATAWDAKVDAGRTK